MFTINNTVIGEFLSFNLLYLLPKYIFYREQLHQGVLNDIERRQRRKAENLYNLQKQIDLTKELKKSQYDSSDVT